MKIGCLWYKGVSSSPLCYDWGGLADSTLHSSLDVGVDLNPLRFSKGQLFTAQKEGNICERVAGILAEALQTLDKITVFKRLDLAPGPPGRETYTLLRPMHKRRGPSTESFDAPYAQVIEEAPRKGNLAIKNSVLHAEEQLVVLNFHRQVTALSHFQKALA